MENIKPVIELIRQINKTNLGFKAIIAGGAVADIFSGYKVPKDIDVVVKATCNFDYNKIKDVVTKLGGTFEENRSGSGSCAKGNDNNIVNNLNNMRMCANFKVRIPHCDKEIDIICINIDPIDRVREFPCNRSMIWVDQNGDIEMLEPFLEFIDGNLMFFCTAKKEYKERTIKYFPEHVVCFDLGEWYGRK